MKKLRKTLVLLMVVAIMVSSMMLGASARTVQYEWNIVPHTRTINDVLVIGDSISAGYGLFGQWNIPARFNLSHGERVEGAYPAIIEDALGCRLYNMSRCQYRSTELRRIIDPEYEAWLSQPENYMEKFLSDGMASVSLALSDNFVQDAYDDMAVAEEEIRKADAIILNFGSNDGFTQALEANVFKAMYYAFGMNLEMAMGAVQGTFSGISSMDQLMQMVVGMGIKDFLSDYNEGVEKFKQNYDGIVKRILDVNPKTEIYFVGMFNTFKNTSVTGLDKGLLKDFGELQANSIFNYVTQESQYKDVVSYIDCLDVETHEQLPLINPIYYMNFLVIAHPTYAGHQDIACRILDSMNLRAMGMDGNIYPGDLVNVPDDSSVTPVDPVNYVRGFTDVRTTDWFASFVDYVAGKGIMTGTAPSTFAPNKTVTRAEIVTMLYAMEGKPEIAEGSTFADVANGSWYEKPIVWAAANGITAGYADNTFRPDAEITRQQMITMLYQYAQLKQADVTASGDLTKFSDMSQIEEYAITPIQWAVGQGLMEGNPDGTIKPQGKTTRAEAAVIMKGFDTKILGK